MGYDMHFVTRPQGEAEALAEAREVFDKALDVRDALPQSARGNPTQDDFLNERYAADATPEYIAAQDRVHEAYLAMNTIERSYFRASIWTMGNLRDAMYAFGMIYNDDTRPEFPDYDYRAPVGAATEALGGTIWVEATREELTQASTGDTDEQWVARYQERYDDGRPVPPEDVARAREILTESDAVRRYHDPSPDARKVIPGFKFGTNDGWVVTPDESLAALSAYHEFSIDQRLLTLKSAGFGTDEARGHWEDWLEYLLLSTEYDGFEVH